MTSHKISDIEEIGPKLIIKLARAGITDQHSLLSACATKKGREEISLKTGIKKEKLLKWVNTVDLYRVEGVDIESIELLEAVGVEALDELKKFHPMSLYEKMKKINSTKKIVLQIPSLEETKKLIEQASKMNTVVMN